MTEKMEKKVLFWICTTIAVFAAAWATYVTRVLETKVSKQDVKEVMEKEAADRSKDIQPLIEAVKKNTLAIQSLRTDVALATQKMSYMADQFDKLESKIK